MIAAVAGTDLPRRQFALLGIRGIIEDPEPLWHRSGRSRLIGRGALDGHGRDGLDWRCNRLRRLHLDLLDRRRSSHGHRFRRRSSHGHLLWTALLSWRHLLGTGLLSWPQGTTQAFHPCLGLRRLAVAGGSTVSRPGHRWGIRRLLLGLLD